MSSLYDVLGLSKNATAEQVEQAYQLHLKKIKERDSSSATDADLVRLQALREAYAVLSSPTRRENYDEKIKRSQQIQYQVVEPSTIPWVSMLVTLALLIGGGIYLYKNHENKLRLERLEFEASKAQAAADEAKRLEEVEKIRLERQILADKRRDEQRRESEMERSRREGEQVHAQLERQAALEAREKERTQRQAANDQIREEQMARQRVQRDAAAMRRALDIPIRRH
jgi:curved DNA-binding protein CbpA